MESGKRGLCRVSNYRNDNLMGLSGNIHHYDRPWLNWFWVAVAALIPLTLYGLVRIFLFIEVFIGLRSVPVGLYKSVNWSYYIPNI